jgi:hypothetical protein
VWGATGKALIFIAPVQSFHRTEAELCCYNCYIYSTTTQTHGNTGIITGLEKTPKPNCFNFILGFNRGIDANNLGKLSNYKQIY